jgi:hypothetical protein
LLFRVQAVVVTNTILQEEHMKLCPKLRVIDVSMMFAGLYVCPGTASPAKTSGFSQLKQTKNCP